MAMNNKNTPSGKSLKMSADDLKEMVKAAVAECLGEEKEDTPPAEETAGEGMDVMSVIEEAVEAATEKRKARKEAGEEVPEEITPDEIIAEAAAILDGLTAEEEAKADDAEAHQTDGAQNDRLLRAVIIGQRAGAQAQHGDERAGAVADRRRDGKLDVAQADIAERHREDVEQGNGQVRPDTVSYTHLTLPTIA